MAKLDKKSLWNKCIKAGVITGHEFPYESVTAKDLKEMLDKHTAVTTDEVAVTAETNNEKENVKMAKKNVMREGSTFLMNVKGVISEYEVVEISEKTVLLSDEDGNERKFLRTIVEAAFRKQDELRAELESEDDEELDDIVDEDEEELDDEDSDESGDDEEDSDDEDEEEETPAPKKQPKTSKTKKDEKKSNKYWENEEPILADLEMQEVRYYEEAGKFQLFGKYEKNGKKNLGRGVTIDVGDLSEKDAMKLISNLVYAVKDRVIDSRIDEAVAILEAINSEVNPEDYVFTMKELKGMDDDVIRTIAKKLGVDLKKNKTVDLMRRAIIKAQQ